MNFNQSQLEAINSNANSIAVLAGPGSGKTRTLVARVERLIAGGVSPDQIVVITFTNAAADEVTHRLSRTIGYCGTLHGFMLRLIQAFGRHIGYSGPVSVIDEEDATKFKKETIGRINYKGSMEAFNRALSDHVDSSKVMNTTQIAACGYRRELVRANLVDFDSILVLGYTLLSKPALAFPAYKHLLVDEYQDSGDWDARIYDKIPIDNKFFVGDPDQCQPAGTLVRMADGISRKPIEELKKGDKILTYCRHSKCAVKNGVVAETKARTFNGTLYRISANEKSTLCTPNHKWLIRWPSGTNRELQNTWCTYLMRKGDYFRVGKTRFFRSSGTPGEPIIGLSIRFNQESADSAWILKVHQSASESLAYEQIVSANYGLPEACFRGSSTGFTQEVIDAIFQSIPNQVARAVRCLQDHGRELEFPLFDRKHPRTRRTVQEVHACNLVSDLMCVPVVDDAVDYKNRNGKWFPIKVSRESFFGTVYSLDVTPHHKYIANGIVTCNSIFSFRGGNIAHIIAQCKRSKVIYLEQNYRSDKAICDAAQLLIEHNTNRIAKKTLPVSANNGALDHWFNIPHPGRELQAIANDIQEHGCQNDCAVLIRTNYLVNQTRSMLESFGVKCRAPESGASSFPFWKKARVFVSLLANPENDFVARQWLKLNMDTKETNRIALVATSRKESINTFHLKLPRSIELRQVPALMAGKIFDLTVTEVSKLINKLPPGAGVSDLAMAMAVEPNAENFAPKEQDGVVVTTMHSAKGREWGTVYLPAFEQEVIPSKRKSLDLEEERRLAYVAITRAKHRLVVCVCKERQTSEWQDKPQPVTPSQFLNEAQIC